jgi:hypothetical protein
MPIIEIAPFVYISKGGKIDKTYVLPQGLYKTLSLVEASKAGIMIPKTLLVIDPDIESIRHFTSTWLMPILRVDYVSRPRNKLLGGIPITSMDSLKDILLFLNNKGYYLLLHPYIDRFQNIYSAGVLLERGSAISHVEIVGTGFDAGDLRLGLSAPHEMFEIDLYSNDKQNAQIISPQDYVESRRKRLERRALLRAYTRYVNSSKKLCSDLGEFNGLEGHIPEDSIFVPETYTPLTYEATQNLKHASRAILENVIEKLPPSKAYAASFSFFKQDGWLLWDIYGQWYER